MKPTGQIKQQHSRRALFCTTTQSARLIGVRNCTEPLGFPPLSLVNVHHVQRFFYLLHVSFNFFLFRSQFSVCMLMCTCIVCFFELSIISISCSATATSESCHWYIHLKIITFYLIFGSIDYLENKSNFNFWKKASLSQNQSCWSTFVAVVFPTKGSEVPHTKYWQPKLFPSRSVISSSCGCCARWPLCFHCVSVIKFSLLLQGFFAPLCFHLGFSFLTPGGTHDIQCVLNVIVRCVVFF